MSRKPTPVMESPPGPYTIIDGRSYLYFVGTGYLGLQGHPEVIRAACEAVQQYGIGSATSRSGFGNLPPTLLVERRAAEFFGMDDAFYFASGYSGMSILAAALDGAFDAVFVDELSHYSLWEAARLSSRPVAPFGHRDPADLSANLKARLQPPQRPLVLSDGVFAARGSIAPVADYQAVLAEYPGAVLCIDDAHGLGVLGENGRGTLEYAGLFGAGVNAPVTVAPANLQSEIQAPKSIILSSAFRPPPSPFSTPLPSPALLCCGTLSKAIGGYGGIIPGARGFVEDLKTRSHYYGGASAPPVPAAAATARALEFVMADPGMRGRLWENVALLKSGLRAMGLPADDTRVPIVCLTLGDGRNMQRIQQELMHRGIAIAYMAAYSGLGPEGALRLAVFATHTPPMIEQLLENLQRIV